MKTIKSLLIISLLLSSFSVFAQNIIEGTVYEEVDGKRQPLQGANVYWKIVNVGTVTDEHGHYSIEIHPTIKCLVFSFVGYENDTVHHMAEPQHYDHVMTSPITLGEVEVASRQKAQYVSTMDPLHIEHITSEALRRCACCSLAESFETNASVDVTYADAVTGAKQIELLGLSGLYTQMMTENMPNFRGLASAFGLGYVPGTWLQGISVSKGTSSVRNGYESISGQINVDFKEPQEDHGEKLFINGFVNTMAMTELNFNTRVKVGKNDGLMLLGHVGFNPMKMDGNADGFLDDPVSKQYSAFLRYNHPNTGHFGCKLGIKALKEERISGQKEGAYSIGINTERYEAFAKTGFIFDRPETSLGIQQQLTYHKLNSSFGRTYYNATQLSYYVNLLFDSYLVNDHHKYSLGASYSFDRYLENHNLFTTLQSVPQPRVEQVPGAFAEYVFSDDHHWTVIGGFRADYNTYYDRLFYTPRLHLRFRTDNQFAIRVSAGKGYRSPNVLAENSTMLASSRQILFIENPKMEEAWNYGMNLSKQFMMGEREAQLLVDAYRTDFVNQIVLDRDADAHQILIYNLNGKSYSNSVQVQFDYELFRNFEVSAAFRYSDVKMTINDTLREKPFVNRYKGLLTLSYAPGTWQFDVVSQFNGDSRIPDMSGNATAAATEDQNLERSPFYVMLSAQVTKKLGKHWELYFGGENLTNYRQNHPVVAASDPFGTDFDASMVWGPLSGIKGYLGFRFQIK